MGTRSLLAYDMKNGGYHVQYMQFDGYPSVKGKEFYETIVTSLQECPSHFTKNGKPNSAFFKRIKHFLDNYQYASGHSIDNNWVCKADEWDAQDANAAWKYLFDKDGNFHFFQNWRDERYDCTIPWDFTYALATTFSKGDLGFPYDDSKLAVWWNSLEQWEGKTDPPMLSLESAEALSFPDQGDEGWRDCGRLRIMNIIGKDDAETAILKKHAKLDLTTQFYKDKRKRKKKYHYPIFHSDYLTVKDCPEKDLPLLMATLKRKDAQRLLDERLGADPMVECADCENDFQPNQVKPWKHERSVKLCHDCYDQRVQNENEKDHLIDY